MDGGTLFVTAGILFFVILFGVLGILIVIGLLQLRKRMSKLPSKEQLVIDAVAYIFGSNVYYEPKGRLANDPDESGLLWFEDQTQDDHIFGTYKGLVFEMVDAHFTKDGTDKDGNMTTYTVFGGLWMVVKLQKSIENRVLIFNKKAFEYQAMRFKKWDGQYSSVELEDLEFNHVFRVLAITPQDVFYILTPRFMERLTAITRIQTENTVNADVLVVAGVYGNMLHIGFGSIPDAFDSIRYFAENAEQARAMALEDLRLPVSILESLVE